MNKFKLFSQTLFSTILLLTLGSANAGIISAPENLSIMSVNGKASDNRSALQLTQGRHLIELKYDGLFETNADDTDARIISGRLYLPLNIENSGNYQIQVAKMISEEMAREFIAEPIVYLVDEQGNKQEKMLLDQNQLITSLFLTM